MHTHSHTHAQARCHTGGSNSTQRILLTSPRRKRVQSPIERPFNNLTRTHSERGGWQLRHAPNTVAHCNSECDDLCADQLVVWSMVWQLRHAPNTVAHCNSECDDLCADQLVVWSMVWPVTGEPAAAAAQRTVQQTPAPYKVSHAISDVQTHKPRALNLRQCSNRAASSLENGTWSASPGWKYNACGVPGCTSLQSTQYTVHSA
jgi:hypothetical protein